MNREVVRKDALRFYIYLRDYKLVTVRIDIEGILYYDYWNSGRSSTWDHPIDNRKCHFNAKGEANHALVIELDSNDFLKENLAEIRILANKFTASLPSMAELKLILNGLFSELTFGLLSAKCSDHMGTIHQAISDGRSMIADIADKITLEFYKFLRRQVLGTGVLIILPAPTSGSNRMQLETWAREIYLRFGNEKPSKEEVDALKAAFAHGNWQDLIARFLYNRDFEELKNQLEAFSTKILEGVPEMQAIKERWIAFRDEQIALGNEWYSRGPVCAQRHTLFNFFPAIKADYLRVLNLYQTLMSDLKDAQVVVSKLENMAAMLEGKPEQNVVKAALLRFDSDRQLALAPCNLIISFYQFESGCRNQPLPTDDIRRNILVSPFGDDDPWNDPQRGWTDPVEPNRDFRIITSSDRQAWKDSMENSKVELQAIHSLVSAYSPELEEVFRERLSNIISDDKLDSVVKSYSVEALNMLTTSAQNKSNYDLEKLYIQTFEKLT